MIRLEVRKIGGALGIVLPPEAVHALDVAEGATLQLTAVPGGGYLLSRVEADVERKMQLVDDIAERYRDTLQDLEK